MAEAINKALSHWPRERFPEGFQSFWDSQFEGYTDQTVADAIDAVRMKSDPFVPTCDMVREILHEWGIAPAKRDVPAWDRLDYLRVKAERDRIQAQQDDDERICEAMSDATFETLARQEIAKFEPDVRAFRCYSPHRKVGELRRSRRLLALVAAHARAHGLVKGGLFQEASR